MAWVLSSGRVPGRRPDGLHHGQVGGAQRELAWPCYSSKIFSPKKIMSNEEVALSCIWGGCAEWWGGHLSQVTVGPEHRRLGLANRLMEGLEEISDGKNCYFVDLFVRFSLYLFHMLDWYNFSGWATRSPSTSTTSLATLSTGPFFSITVETMTKMRKCSMIRLRHVQKYKMYPLAPVQSSNRIPPHTFYPNLPIFYTNISTRSQHIHVSGYCIWCSGSSIQALSNIRNQRETVCHLGFF